MMTRVGFGAAIVLAMLLASAATGNELAVPVAAIEAAETRMEQERLPKWLSVAQRKELADMTDEDASKALLQWTEEHLKAKELKTAQDEGVERLLATARLKRAAQTTSGTLSSGMPIFTEKEQAAFAKMTDKERETYLRKKGIRVKIDRDKIKAELERQAKARAEEPASGTTVSLTIDVPIVIEDKLTSASAN